MKNAQGSDKHRSNASSETHSDCSDTSNNKPTCENGKCRTNLTECHDKSRATVSKGVGAKNEQESDQEKEASSRPSKDEGSFSSDDNNEYNLYFYDTKAVTNNSSLPSKCVKSNTHATTTPDASVVLSNLKKTEDPWDILFARAEGLYAHGHTREACIIGVQLAEELLANPPDLMIEGPPVPVKNKKKRVRVLKIKIVDSKYDLSQQNEYVIVTACESGVSSNNMSCIGDFSKMWILMHGTCRESRISQFSVSRRPFRLGDG